MSKEFVCPRCQEHAGVSILHGANLTPSVSAMKGPFVIREIVSYTASETKELPERMCKACGHEWRIHRRKDV